MQETTLVFCTIWLGYRSTQEYIAKNEKIYIFKVEKKQKREKLLSFSLICSYRKDSARESRETELRGDLMQWPSDVYLLLLVAYKWIHVVTRRRSFAGPVSAPTVNKHIRAHTLVPVRVMRPRNEGTGTGTPMDPGRTYTGASTRDWLSLQVCHLVTLSSPTGRAYRVSHAPDALWIL